MAKHFEKYKKYIWLAFYLVFTALAFIFGFQPGKTIYYSFQQSFIEMLMFVPFVFILIGLFDVWFPASKVEKYVGKDPGIKGIFFSWLLGILQSGPLYGAFPVAHILYKKGASAKNIFIYLGVFSCIKVPLLGMEIGYLGLKFTLLSALVPLPLFIAVGYFMEWYLRDKNFEVYEV